MSEGKPTCENCAFLTKPDPDQYIPAFGWCDVPLPPHLIEWGLDSDRRRVEANYTCVFHRPSAEHANAEAP
jgi:hypothetical protein